MIPQRKWGKSPLFVPGKDNMRRIRAKRDSVEQPSLSCDGREFVSHLWKRNRNRFFAENVTLVQKTRKWCAFYKESRAGCHPWFCFFQQHTQCQRSNRISFLFWQTIWQVFFLNTLQYMKNGNYFIEKKEKKIYTSVRR